VRALELLAAGELQPPQVHRSCGGDELRHPTLLAALTWEREALYERIDAQLRIACSRQRARECAAPSPPASHVTARKALGFEELLGRRHRAKRRTAQTTRPPVT